MWDEHGADAERARVSTRGTYVALHGTYTACATVRLRQEGCSLQGCSQERRRCCPPALLTTVRAVGQPCRVAHALLANPLAPHGAPREVLSPCLAPWPPPPLPQARPSSLITHGAPGSVPQHLHPAVVWVSRGGGSTARVHQTERGCGDHHQCRQNPATQQHTAFDRLTHVARGER